MSSHKSFDCKHLEKRDEKKCYFKNKTLSDGEAIDDSLLNGSCEGSCKCSGKKFECEHIDCPEKFGPRLEVGCVRQFANDKCCSVGTVCGNFIYLNQ